MKNESLVLFKKKTDWCGGGFLGEHSSIAVLPPGLQWCPWSAQGRGRAGGVASHPLALCFPRLDWAFFTGTHTRRRRVGGRFPLGRLEPVSLPVMGVPGRRCTVAAGPGRVPVRGQQTALTKVSLPPKSLPPSTGKVSDCTTIYTEDKVNETNLFLKAVISQLYVMARS